MREKIIQGQTKRDTDRPADIQHELKHQLSKYDAVVADAADDAVCKDEESQYKP